MAHYYCNEDAKNLVRLEIENRKSALAVYDEVIELVKKYDGKILNKRFETALKKIDEREEAKVQAERKARHTKEFKNIVEKNNKMRQQKKEEWLLW